MAKSVIENKKRMKKQKNMAQNKKGNEKYITERSGILCRQ